MIVLRWIARAVVKRIIGRIADVPPHISSKNALVGTEVVIDAAIELAGVTTDTRVDCIVIDVAGEIRKREKVQHDHGRWIEPIRRDAIIQERTTGARVSGTTYATHRDGAAARVVDCVWL